MKKRARVPFPSRAEIARRLEKRKVREDKLRAQGVDVRARRLKKFGIEPKEDKPKE